MTLVAPVRAIVVAVAFEASCDAVAIGAGILAAAAAYITYNEMVKIQDWLSWHFWSKIHTLMIILV
jgi:hypothetical protein